MLAHVGSQFGLPFAVIAGHRHPTEVEAREQLRRYRERYFDLWDKAVLQEAVNNALFAVCINNPRSDLRMWRWELKKGRITKRAWRRLRGRVKAGKSIPTPPAMWIDFETHSRHPLAPFVRPL